MGEVRLVHQALSAMSSVAADCFRRIDIIMPFATFGICVVCRVTQQSSNIMCSLQGDQQAAFASRMFVILVGPIMP
jgi:hypothetical protein